MPTPNKQDIATVNKHFADGARPTFLPKWMRQRIAQLLADVREEEREACAEFLEARAAEEDVETHDLEAGWEYRAMHRYVAVHLKSWAAVLRARGAA
jgi:hypothetical protein